MTQQLSPAAKAVLAAFTEDDGMCRDWKHNYHNLDAFSAALRAAVDAVAPEKTIEDIGYVHQSYVDGYKDALYEILILANEFEIARIPDTLC